MPSCIPLVDRAALRRDLRCQWRAAPQLPRWRTTSFPRRRLEPGASGRKAAYDPITSQPTRHRAPQRGPLRRRGHRAHAAHRTGSFPGAPENIDPPTRVLRATQQSAGLGARVDSSSRCRHRSGLTEPAHPAAARQGSRAVRGGTGAVAVCRSDVHRDGVARVLFVRACRPAAGRTLGELRRGLHEAEALTVQQTAAREVAEETGLRTSSAQLIGTIYPDSGLFANAVAVIALTPDPLANGRMTDDGEVAECAWLDQREIGELIADGHQRAGPSLDVRRSDRITDRRCSHPSAQRFRNSAIIRTLWRWTTPKVETWGPASHAPRPTHGLQLGRHRACPTNSSPSSCRRTTRRRPY